MIYFSEEEWGYLSNSQQSFYLQKTRRYNRLKALGDRKFQVHTSLDVSQLFSMPPLLLFNIQHVPLPPNPFLQGERSKCWLSMLLFSNLFRAERIEHRQQGSGLQPALFFPAGSCGPQGLCCIPDPSCISFHSCAVSFLLGITVVKPFFMRCKEQAKESQVKCTDAHGTNNGEQSGRGCEESPFQSRYLVRLQAGLFYFRLGACGKDFIQRIV